MQNPSDTTAAGGVQLNKKTTHFAGDHDCVEITLDVGDDGEAMQSVVTSTTNSAAAAAARTADGREEKISSLSTAVKGSSRIREVSRELKRLDRSKPVTAPALAGLKFIAKNGSAADAWARMEGNFDNLTLKTNGLLHRSRFGQCIGMNEKPRNVKPKKDDLEDDEKSKNDFACELFDALCRRMHIGTGDSITKAELKQICDLISDPSFDSRLQIFLDMVDKDGDGRIVEHEIKEIIVVSASANKLSNIGNAEAEEYARLIMEELDPDNCGYIRIEDLSTLLFQQGQINTTTETSGNNRELSKMLSQKLKPTRDHPLKRYHSKFHHLMTDYWKRVWLLASWVGIMISLFAYKYAQYKNKRDVFRVMGHCVCMAKGAAEILKLNMALILLPVCRNTITWLRNKTTLGVAVPFDDNINFHQMIAVAIAIGVGIHGISHLACDFPRLLSATPEEYKPMERYFGDQPKSYGHFLKGWEGVTGILMVVLMAFAFTLASPWFRRTNNLLISLPENKKLEKPIVFINGLLKKLTGFNAFWYSHHLFVVVYTLLVVHGIKLYLTHEWYKKTTWMYLVVPVVLYAGERLVRAFRSSVKAVKILKAVVYRGDVLTLQMSKPPGFDYKSGQYIFVNCAAVSPFEWHPFSITSAPMDDYVSVHIRRNGDWTGKIISIFKDVCKPPPTGERGILMAECLPGENINPKLPEVLIDGPYGSSTQEYKDYDVVLLIGLGIGATPMISVVKDIVHNIKAKEEEENSLEECSRNHVSVEQELKTRKAYFYWQTREQGSFDWFKGVMNEVGNSKGLIEMHNYCTSVHEEGDARSALITMLQSINRAKNGVDVVSGTKVMTHFGRPKWREVFKGIALNHPGARVGVFYCGPAPPVKELRQLASDFSHKISTKFEFHKENF